ncbi:MAG: bifunctional phosphopantothenoylcysteine decarboxylase/phosphopantothenate--cysteine ligase CoaBC [Bacteroidota bacterium]
MLQNKNIVLGVTGSIAAYKTAHLTRLLTKAGANVKIIMTPASLSFITPLTLSTVSKNPVYSTYSNNETGEWNNHVELALWADVMLIAPASANTIAKMANGLCDNLLLATYLSAKCPVIVAPAMDLDMYIHPSSVANRNKLLEFGNYIIEAESGELASGLVGQGRMAEPENIVDYLTNFFKKKTSLANKKVLVTAGPTYEAIDPVRFIGNHSSGKMGFAIALELAENGAEVVLVTGPTHQKIEHKNIQVIKVTSAQQMLQACENQFDSCSVAVMSAAVADYAPVTIAEQKIKKNDATFTIELKKTTDILAQLGAQKKANQILVGFALETENELANAQKKLEKKNLDFIVLNSLNDAGAGFSADTNKITIIDKHNKTEVFELKSKQQVAQDIVAKIKSLLNV